MINKCHFCSYSNETPMPREILELMANDDMPTEDLILWFQRMIASMDSKGRWGVKIHMGRMHKDQTYYGIWPDFEYNADEMDLINKVANKFEERHAFSSLLTAGTLNKPKQFKRRADGTIWL